MAANQSEPCSSLSASQFDFWLGVWDLSWPAEQTGGVPGETAHGTNRIDRLFGMCAIEERFATADGSLLGRSLSVFDPVAGIWRQTWVDSTGGYLLFTGRFHEQTMELRTDPVERDGGAVLQRMVFREITADSLRWDWQGSSDSGASWSDLWNISYRRAGSTPISPEPATGVLPTG